MAADEGKGLSVVIDVPVDEVTLLEDRARIVRRGVVELAAGLCRVRVEGVAPILSDKTLTGEIFAGEESEDGDDNSTKGNGAEKPVGAEIVDTQVSRRLVVSYDDPDREPAPDEAALQAELREREAEIKRLETESALMERHASGLDKIAQLTYAELTEDVSWGREIGSQWTGRIDDIKKSERELRQRLVTLASDIEERKRARHRLQLRLEGLRNPPERESASIDAMILVERAGQYTVVFDYVVPGACWRPYHTAQLIEPEPAPEPGGKGDGAEKSAKSPAPRVAFSTDACVWQNTGEDWRNAQLIFSTERASLGTDPPILDSDILAVRPKSKEVVVETREQEIQTSGLGAGEFAAREAPELPGIDDGGVVRNFRAPQRSTVPADGCPHRIALSSFESRAEVALVSMPELIECVFTRTTLENRGEFPILAGPVDLIRKSGFVGRTQILFVAAGEKFEIGWGPEPDLRIKRTTEVTEDKSRLLSSWIERTHKVYVMLSNLGSRSHAIEITERVPLSEIDKVKIQLQADKTTGGKQPDKNGFVKWTIDLVPRGYERVQLCYELKKHDDVRGI